MYASNSNLEITQQLFDVNFILCELPKYTKIVDEEYSSTKDKNKVQYNAVLLHYYYLAYIYDNQRALESPKLIDLPKNIRTVLLSYYIDNNDINTEPIWEKILQNDWTAFEAHISNSKKNPNLRMKELALLKQEINCKEINTDVYNLTNNTYTYNELLQFLRNSTNLIVYDDNNTQALFEIVFSEKKNVKIGISHDENNTTSLLNELGEICQENVTIHNRNEIRINSNQDIAGLALWAFILLVIFPIFFMTFCTIVLCKWCCPTVCYERHHYHHPVPLLVNRGNNYNM
jgi:hypothetical protein